MRFKLPRAVAVCVFVFLSVVALVAGISISTVTPYQELFDSLGTSAGATLPASFKVDRTTAAVRSPGSFAAAGNSTTAAGGANLPTNASNGIYNFGAGTTATGSDRAIGFLSSGTATGSGNLYAELTNDSGGPLSALQISYDVEKYRNGSNAAGFCFQMFSSADGVTWTSAGTSFRTAFLADANNNGFATAPGATVTVNGQLTAAIPSGASFYLAWNYAVCAGSTQTNAQALAIDNVSITGIADQQPTNPSGTLQASSTNLSPGDSVTLTVNVTPGSNPVSTGIAVSADLSPLGLGNAAFTASAPNTFTFTGTIPANQPTSSQNVTAAITDAEGRHGNTSPAVLITVQPPASTAPTGTGSATPASVPAGGATQLTVTVTAGTNPVSTGLTVTGDLSAIGGSSAQVFEAANNVFTWSAAVSHTSTTGSKSLPITIADDQGRLGAVTIPLNVTAPLANSTIVISQIYGGGGNSNAVYRNDYVELYNRGGQTVDVTGWSLQYASATGSAWNNKQLLGGTIAPGEYYLVSLASGGTAGAPLPDANAVGGVAAINMSATTGKIALVDTFEELDGLCPLDTPNPHIKDFVGYGSTATCQEGGARAPAPSATKALFRNGGGQLDTDDNGSDFATGDPNPRRTAPIVEIGPFVAGTDPRSSATTAPRDATIAVTFSEPVSVDAGWIAISCEVTGLHVDATTASTPQVQYITPNQNFSPGEQCSATVLKDRVHDDDFDDSAAGTDTMTADYTWSFRIATGTAPPYPASEHLAMGNPSNATSSTADVGNFLMEKPEFAVSYNRDLGRPNWVSWHLADEWVGTLTRVDTFRPDPEVPPDWYRVQSFDFAGSGFDRGHMTPNADRDKETSIPINQATFLMSNMVAQAPDNNQGPWANLESYLRTLLPANELYIVAGAAGTGGTGSNGYAETVANGHVAVPKYVWKVALVLPKADGADALRVTCSTRTIAVILENKQGIRTGDPNDWQGYLTTVDAVETLTGYDFFSNVSAPVQACVEAGVNGANPKNEQTITFAPIDPRTFGDSDFGVDATASSGLAVTLQVVSGPATIVNGLVHLTGPGSVTIRAEQAGDVNYNAAPPVERSFTVAKMPPLWSALSSPAIEAGTAFTAVGGWIRGNTDAVPTGSVTIAIGSATATAAIAADGSFSATLPTAGLTPGGSPHAITFSYAGDAIFAGSTAAATLTVADTIAPVVTLNGASPTIVEAGSTFVDPGAAATDSFAGNLTSAIEVSGTVNTSLIGDYLLTYSVSDGYNRVSIVRTVRVVDRTGPTIANLAALPSTLAPTNSWSLVRIAYTATDVSGTPACSLTVSSNNPDAGATDGVVLSPTLVALLAERVPASRPVRVYTIAATCTDSSGNSTTAQTEVTVRRK